MRRRFGCLISVIGVIVVAAGIFSWQLASDSPEWNLATLFKVIGIVDIVIGAGLMLFGFLRMGRQRGD